MEPKDKKEEKPNVVSKDTLVTSQAKYKGSSLHDLVDIKITKAGRYYKVGDTDKVHPATAAIFKELGIIDTYEGDKVEEKSAE